MYLPIHHSFFKSIEKNTELILSFFDSRMAPVGDGNWPAGPWPTSRAQVGSAPSRRELWNQAQLLGSADAARRAAPADREAPADPRPRGPEEVGTSRNVDADRG